MKDSTVIQKLLIFLWQFKGWLLIAMLSAFLSVFLNVLAPFLIGRLIDALATHQDIGTLFTLLLLLAGSYLFYSFFQWGMMMASNRIAFLSSGALRKQLYEKLQHLPIVFYDQHAKGDLISHFVNDADLVSDGLLQGISTILSGFFTILLAALFMFNINRIMTFLVILSAIFTFLIARMITKRTQKYFTKQANTLGKLNGLQEEMIAGMRTIKAYHYEANALHAFQKMNKELYTSGVKSQFYGSLANPSTRFVMNGAYAFVGVAGAVLALMSKISVGDISSFLIYSTLFSKPFTEISGVMTQLQSALASGKRIFTLIEVEEEHEDASLPALRPTKGQVIFEQVSFYYDKTKPLMNQITISIKGGTRVAIVGKTGAGKTTLVNLLMRFYDVKGGRILIDGQDIQSCSRDSIRRNFGMVLQDTYLFEDSIAANIAYGKPEASREEIIMAAKRSGAHEFIRHLSKGYDTQLHVHDMLSQGQRQLLTITRIFLMNPAMLILDEATSSIDIMSEQHVNRAMEELMKGRTSFVIAHRLSTIVDADLILVMEQGTIIEQGTHQELLQNKGAYYQLYQAQFS